MSNAIKALHGQLANEIFILKLIVLLHPVFSWLRTGWERPLIISVPDENILKEVVAVIKGYGIPPVKSLAITPKELKDTIKSVEYNLAVFRYSQNRYTVENLQILVDSMEEISDEESLNILSLIFVIGAIPTELFSYCSGCIYIKDNMRPAFVNYSEEWVRPFIEYVTGLSFDGVTCAMKNETYSYSNEYVILKYILRIWEMYLGSSSVKEADVRSQCETLKKTIMRICSEWNAVSNDDVYLEVFRRFLFEYIEKTGNIKCVPCNRVDNLFDPKAGRTICFNEKFYHFPTQLFEALIRYVEKKTGLSNAKGGLVRSGLLCYEGQKRTYYTPKVDLITASGEVISPRMFKLDRVKLDVEGELTLCEMLSDKEE